MLGYILNPHKKVHPIFGLDIGWGDYEVNEIKSNNTILEGDFTSFAPRIGIEANAIPWLKFNVGLGYRHVAGGTNNYFDITDLNSPLIDFRLHFGWFGN